MKLWRAVAAVALAVAAVALAVTVPTLQCRRGGGSGEGLQEALDATNRSLAESRGRWQRCREELAALQGKVLELEQALADVTRLEGECTVTRPCPLRHPGRCVTLSHFALVLPVPCLGLSPGQLSAVPSAEQNRELGTEVTRQREQLEEEQSLRAKLQRQNRFLQEELWDMRRQRSAGDRLALSRTVPALLLLLGMLLL
ncbi:hypothetical protein DV515_00016592 [Chloebia gouldiae]|uniref:Uncharacterized protein n=1 Tax=Chloebia gouldiae TaxID=44316 RepID=A0A3L8RTM4_CHLGU|nr:hypothetical protein DV515_00016592 [Chloebia gouldiae]